MKNTLIKKYRFWFSSRQSLGEIGKLLVNQNIISGYEYDFENVYEWIIGTTSNANIDLNISRKHKDWEDFSEEPIHVLTMYSGNEPSNELVDRLANMFNKCLKVEIRLGTIEYVGGDDYQYNEQNRLNGSSDTNLDYKSAHQHSSNHREQIQNSDICGCFYCLSIYRPTEINEWIDKDEKEIGQTALCPRCAIDSVIGDKSGIPIDQEFLKNMKIVWFG